MVKGITANDVGNQPGVDATTTCSSSISTASRSRRRSPAPASASRAFSREAIAEFQIVTNHVRHHAGPLGRHPGAGDLEVGHQRPVGQPLRLLPQRRLQRGGSRSPTGCCRIEPAGRRHARRTRSIKNKMHYFASYEYERRAGHHLLGAVGAAGPDLHDPVQEQSEEPARPRRRPACRPGRSPDVRGSRWNWDNPFSPGRRRPSLERIVPDQGCHQRSRHLVAGRRAATRFRRSGSGYDNFFCSQTPLAAVVGTPRVPTSRA